MFFLLQIEQKKKLLMRKICEKNLFSSFVNLKNQLRIKISESIKDFDNKKDF